MDPLHQLGFGRLQKNTTYLVVGERGTGKTLLCMLAALHYASKKLTVVYMLTSSVLSFNLAERILTLNPLSKEHLEHIVFVRLQERSSEGRIPYIIEALKPSMLIFDEANWGYENYIAENIDLTIYRSRLLSNLLAEIHGLRTKIGFTVIYTADLYEGGKILGYKVMSYFSDHIIELTKSKNSNRRFKANLITDGLKIKSCSYRIGDIGFQVGEGN
jgi:KaiC/GvpD/RAD55 family RecA-like ATPase